MQKIELRWRLFLICMFLGINLGFSQEGSKISFEKTTHDFGAIQEEDGPVTFEFRFTNAGKSSLKITDVKASCGCTTPGWTKEEVGPGEVGFIKAQYDPKNRPGSFNKSLTVSSTDTENPRQYLFIKGNVAPRAKTPADDFPTQMGALRFKYRSFNLGKITNEKSHEQTFDFFNDGDKAVRILTDKIEKPAHLQVRFEPETIPAQGKAQVTIQYDARQMDDLGYISESLLFYTDEDPAFARKNMYIIATLEEYFPPMSEEDLAMSPRLKFDRSEHDFKSINEGETVSTSFTFKNTGKQDLIIRKTKANCGCTVSKPSKEILKPGESGSINVSFNSTNRKGNQQKSVTIYSNDPTAPSQMIRIKARVN